MIDLNSTVHGQPLLPRVLSGHSTISGGLKIKSGINGKYEAALEEGASGFQGLRVWPKLALGLRDLHLNRGFRVSRCVTGCGFDQFLCSGFRYFAQNSYIFRFSR